MYDEYQDVDPSPEGDKTVLFVASDDINSSECEAEVDCVRDIVVRLNLTTKEREVLYNFTAPDRVNENMHDIDRISEHTLLVAGISYDRIYMVNYTTGIITWQWEMQSEYSFGTGGSYPSDWTHMNDVEQLPDGRMMASPRNHDQVIFIDPETGLQENWTLGSDNNHAILYEQHQPDYIPKSRGGPAVLVADSQNHRIVEYERREGEWVQTWVWTDSQMQWPRDADRLPNGNTLIEDSNGGRIIEINPDGEIVWEIEVKSTYDVERLGTGDESSGGESASNLGLESQRVSKQSNPKTDTVLNLRTVLLTVVPSKIRSAIAFVSPAWMGFTEIVVAGIIFLNIFIWIMIEIYWRREYINIQSPIEMNY